MDVALEELAVEVREGCMYDVREIKQDLPMYQLLLAQSDVDEKSLNRVSEGLMSHAFMTEI